MNDASINLAYTFYYTDEEFQSLSIKVFKFE